GQRDEAQGPRTRATTSSLASSGAGSGASTLTARKSRWLCACGRADRIACAWPAPAPALHHAPGIGARAEGHDHSPVQRQERHAVSGGAVGTPLLTDQRTVGTKRGLDALVALVGFRHFGTST